MTPLKSKYQIAVQTTLCTALAAVFLHFIPILGIIYSFSAKSLVQCASSYIGKNLARLKSVQLLNTNFDLLMQVNQQCFVINIFQANTVETLLRCTINTACIYRISQYLRFVTLHSGSVTSNISIFVIKHTP